MASTPAEIVSLYGLEGRIEKSPDGMSAYITYTTCKLLKTITKTSALNYQRCSGRLGRTHTFLRKIRVCGLGVVKEQVRRWVGLTYKVKFYLYLHVQQQS